MPNSHLQQSLQRWKQKYINKLNDVNTKIAANKASSNDETIFMNEALRMLRDAVQFDKKKYRYHIRQQMNDRLRQEEQSFKLRFRCQNKSCKSYNEIVLRGIRCNQSRKWTSYFGIVIYGPNGLSILYSFKVFKQKCIECSQWGISGFYQSGFNSILDLFRLIIRNVLKNSKGEKIDGFRWTYLQKTGLKPNIYNRGRGHQSTLCQGCLQRQCINYYQEKEPSETPQSSQKDECFSDSSQRPISRNSRGKNEDNNWRDISIKRQTLSFIDRILDQVKRQSRSQDKSNHSVKKNNQHKSDLVWSDDDESEIIQDLQIKRKRKNWILK